jgi:hypothetical protein
MALAAAFLSVTFIAYYRSTAQPAGRIAADELNRPSKQPDRIVLSWTANPANSAAVNWRTATAVQQGLAEIALAGDGPAFVKQSRRVTAASADFQSDLGQARYHSVRFDELKPDTQYAYRVGDGWNWSEWFHFRTTSDKPAPIAFAYVGDAQNDIHSLWSRLIRSAYAAAPDMRFLIHAGDLVNVSHRDAEWGEWFRAAGWISGMVPYVPTPGNHEYPNQNSVRKLTAHWRPQFTLPENGLPGLEETSYYLDVQGVRIVILNSNERHKEQAEWLDKLLAANPNRWSVLAFHHPIYSAARKRDNKDLRELWKPVIEKYRVDLVLTGHDHTYARGNAPSGVNQRSANAGTVYVVSVSGPKMYNLDREPWMARAAEDTQLFQIIRIDGDRLSYESRTARGILYDAFDLRKRSGKPNELTNRIPKTPENRRDPAAVSAAAE